VSAPIMANGTAVRPYRFQLLVPMFAGVRWVGAALRRSKSTGRDVVDRAHAGAASAVSARFAAPAPATWATAIKAALTERAGTPRATLTFDEAIAIVCDATGWPVGHVWTQTPSGWRSSGAWYSGASASNLGDQVNALRETSAITDLGSGRGIVAAVLHLESCRFLPGLEGLGSPLRQAHAAALRFRGVVGVPVRSTVGGHDKVTAVLEFVTAQEIEPDGALAEALLDVAEHTRKPRSARKKSTTPTKAASAASSSSAARIRRTKSLDAEIPDNLAG